MSAVKLNRIRENLSEKRVRLQEWIHTTPSDHKTVFLGPATEEAVYSHIKTIESSIEEAEAGTIDTCVVCEESVELSPLEGKPY